MTPRRGRWARGAGGVARLAALALGAAAAVLAAAALRGGGLRVNPSASLPRGLYRLAPAGGPPRRGDLVLACPPAGLAALARRRGYLPAGRCPGRVQPLGKLVLAAAGDVLEVSAGGLRLNGLALPATAPLAADARSRPLPRWASGRYRVRPREVWLVASHPRSLDSRYFGPVDAAQVLGRLTPLATAGGADPAPLAALLRGAAPRGWPAGGRPEPPRACRGAVPGTE
jgi:conjugative transfer signal peptidase TraF